MGNSKRIVKSSNALKNKQQNIRKPFNNGKQHYKKPNFKNQWRQDEARQQKLQEREELRVQKVAELKAEVERVQREKEERVRNYKKKRLEKTKVISQKTKRGQPLMKVRMEFLLKQIQEMKCRS